jgi:hypothetical protein
MTADDILERIKIEAVVAYFNLLIQTLCGPVEENEEILSGYPISRLKLEPWTTRIGSRSAKQLKIAIFGSSNIEIMRYDRNVLKYGGFLK